MEESYTHTPILETERLILRPLTLNDAEDIYEGWAKYPEVTQYMSWNTHTSVAQTREWLKSVEDAVDFPDNYSFGFVLKENGVLIGSGGLYFDEDIERFEIGYILAKPYWGQGLATEAARRFLDFAFHDLGMTEFFAFHAVDNPASGNIIQKLGFRYDKEGTFVSDDGSKSYPRKEYYLDL